MVKEIRYQELPPVLEIYQNAFSPLIIFSTVEEWSNNKGLTGNN